MKRHLLRDSTGSWFPLIDMPCRWGNVYANGSTRFHVPFARGPTVPWAAHLAMYVLCEAIIIKMQIKQALRLGE